jgi:response regulator RpfG family c-di-GMP phosphodiesterase
VAEKILLVDDDANILSAYRRTLRKYRLESAEGGEQALETIRTKGPFAVIVSDLRMPGMDGIELLGRVRELSKDTVRIMLTGNADLEASIAAVNEGSIFRFLTKPCPPDILTISLEAALEQYRLVTAERELIRGTLRGSIKVLSEILAITNPEAFGRSERIKRPLKSLIKVMDPPDGWRIELAGMLSQIGSVSIPENTLRKALKGWELPPQEAAMHAHHPAVGAGLIGHIPRLGEVGEIIAHQNERYDAGKEAPLGARMLKVVLDYDALQYAGTPKFDALAKLKDREHQGSYDPAVLKAFETAICLEEGHLKQKIRAREIKVGMVLEENLFSRNGVVLMVKGQEITEASLSRLNNFVITSGIREPINVLIPYNPMEDENNSEH